MGDPFFNQASGVDHRTHFRKRDLPTLLTVVAVAGIWRILSCVS
jgi:hypothetical protein